MIMNRTQRAKQAQKWLTIREENYVFIPPDGWWGWVIVFAVFYCNFTTQGVLLSCGLFFEILSKEFDTSLPDVIFMYAILFGIYYCCAPLTCAFINRFGCRIIGIFGGLLSAFSYFLQTFCNYYGALVCCVFTAVGFNMIYFSGFIIVTFYFESRRPMACMLSSLGSTLGGTIHPIIYSRLLETYAWFDVFYVMSFMLLTTCLMAILYFPLEAISVASATKDSIRRFPMPKTQVNFHFPTVDKVVSQTKLKNQYYAIAVEKSRVLYKERCLECQTSYCKPLDRDDIFYNGNLYLLPYFKHLNQDEIHGRLQYHMAVTRIYSAKERRCAAIERTLGTMLNFGICNSPSLHLWLVGTTFCSMGQMIPYLFVKERAVKADIYSDEAHTFWLITTIGVGCSLGRVASFMLPTTAWVNVVCYSSVSTILAGLLTAGSSCEWFVRPIYQYVYCLLFGLTIACSSQYPLITTYVFGLPYVTNILGLYYLCFGIGAFTGIFLTGLLYHYFDTFSYGFYVAGSGLMIYGICIYVMLFVRKWEKDRDVFIT